MKTTVIYHRADFDGEFCHQIARKFLGESYVEYIGWDFADPPLAVPPEGQIYILDLPVDRTFGFDYRSPESVIAAFNGAYGHTQFCKRVIWIDHHKSSIETQPMELAGYRIDGVAACRLAWQWFNYELSPHNEGVVTAQQLPVADLYKNRIVSEPLAVRLAGEYDIWDKRDPRAEVFQFGLRSQELTATEWSMLLDSQCYEGGQKAELIDTLLGKGLTLQCYQQRQDTGTMKRSFILQFEGMKFLAVNARCNSLAFAAKDVVETGHDALLAFCFNGKDWSVSLYNARHNPDANLLAIAQKYPNGGGHRGACGFRTATLPFIPTAS